MKIQAAKLNGIFRVEIEPIRDHRGYFARTYCAQEFAAAGLDPAIAQCNTSLSSRRGTLRGLHFQRPPYAEAKLIRCISGAIYDVVVDVRRDSPTYGQWEAFELDSDGFLSLYVGEGFAHGFQALTDDARIIYNMSEFYHPDHAAGVRWDDPALSIPWPIKAPILSAIDSALPFLDPTP
jgi:dTDP-4-dehydrorhamnose 3,5-epimerase